VIYSSTFQFNVNLKYLSLRNNNILDIINTGLLSGINPTYLDLSGNMIRSLDNSVFRKQVQLETLILSGNMLQSLEPGIFTDCTNLRNLSLSANRISEISIALFYGLEHLEHLDLSNNYIEELNPHLFDSFSISTKRQNHQVTKLKHLNLANNYIRFFNFELYFPMSIKSDTPNPPFQLEYLNLSSNRLTTLDVASMKWLNQTTAVTDLTANPWNCDCSVLLEVWRGLKHKLTLHCASPRQLQGKSWGAMEKFCSEDAEDMNNESKRRSEDVSTSAEHKGESEVSAQKGGPSVVTTILIVTCVFLVCAIGGGLILAKVVKRLRNRAKTPENCDVDDPRRSHISLHSYAEIGAGSSQITDQYYADVGIRPSYITVQS
jgi:hypothetical protein